MYSRSTKFVVLFHLKPPLPSERFSQLLSLSHVNPSFLSVRVNSSNVFCNRSKARVLSRRLLALPWALKNTSEALHLSGPSALIFSQQTILRVFSPQKPRPIFCSAISSMARLNLNALLPPGHFESSDCFQQMLSIDSALEALSMSKNNLALKLQALADDEGLEMPLYLSPGDWEQVISSLAYHRHSSENQPLSPQGAAEYDTIQQSLADLAILAKTFEELQAAARHRFELRARSLRQGRTGIMDFPDEVLMIIFENFRLPMDFPIFPPYPGDNKDDITTIKNIRLTCLRFRQNSSHLLVRYLNVSPDVSSLNHLERISSHPEISRGERILRIDLRYYSAAIAADFQAFSTMCYERLSRELGWLTEQAQYEDTPQCRYLPTGMTLESAKVSITGMLHILSLWEPFRNGTHIEESAHLHEVALALRRGHRRYRKLFQQQDRILQDGHFARAVAAAASKSKVWLFMSDTDREICFGNDRYELQREKLGRLDFMLIANPYRLQYDLTPMIKPQHSWLADGNAAEEVPNSLLYEIPLAMRTAEVNLVGFEVNMHCPHSLNLDISKEQLSDLTEVTKDLKTFKFCTRKLLGRRTDPVPRAEDLTGFYAYLRATMGPRLVPNLHLELANGFGLPDGIQFPIKPLLGSLDWHGLKSAVLEHVDVDLQDLKNIMGMLQPGTRLVLKDIRLGSGTWAAALDSLRSKVSRDSWLAYPKGAECDLMTAMEYANAFCEFYGSSRATLYITSVEGVENPLRNYNEAGEASAEL